MPTSTTTQVTVYTPDEIAAMNQTDRIMACKPERAALDAWKRSGRDGDRPLTPILSWMENPTTPKRRSVSARASFVRTPADTKTLTDIVLTERPKGTSWNRIAKMLEEAQVPSSNRGCQWFNKTAFTAAVKLGLVEAGETLNRRDVPKAAVVQISAAQAKRNVKEMEKAQTAAAVKAGEITAPKASARKPVAKPTAAETRKASAGRKAVAKKPAAKKATTAKKVAAKK